MKKLATRVFIVVFFLLSLGLSFTVSAEKIRPGNYTRENVETLQHFLLGQSDTISRLYDVYPDEILNAVDLTLMKRSILEKTSTAETTTIPKVSTTTLPNSGTTDALNVDTTTSTSLTQTIEITSTTTTTTAEQETVPTVKRDGYVYLNYGINSTIKTTVTIPNYNYDLYEVKDGAFLFEKDDITYAYSVLCEKQTPLYKLFSDNSLIKGIHVWVYNGDEVPVSIYDELPDTSELTFTMDDENYNGQSFEYNLKEYAALNYGDVVMVSELINPKRPIYPSDIACNDYSLNGVLDADDVEIMTRYALAQPFNLFDENNRETFFRYFDKMVDLNHTNMVFLKTDSTQPIPYAYNIPTADIILDPNETDAEREGLEYAKVPVQILPKSFAKKLADYPEIKNLSDDPADYYAWFKEEQKWAKVANDSKIWRFQSGFYVYVIDDDGNHLLEWIK